MGLPVPPATNFAPSSIPFWIKVWILLNWISETQYNKIQTLIQKGIDEGAKLVAGGTGKPEGLDKGYFVKPYGVSLAIEIASFSFSKGIIDSTGPKISVLAISIWLLTSAKTVGFT